MARRARSEQTSDSGDFSLASNVSGNADAPIIEPGEIDASADARPDGGSDATGETIRYNKDGSIRKKRGPNRNKANASIPLDVNAIQFSLSGIHSLLGIAMFPKNEEQQKAFALSEHESKVLAENVAAVARHYDVVASQKSVDWFNLIIALSAIEGPRIFMFLRNRPAKAPKMPAQPNPGFVGTRQPANERPATYNGKGPETRKPTAEEKTEMLNEPLILQPMQSG